MPIQIYNAINPLGTAVDVFGDPVLAEFVKEHAPPNADKGGQEVVWLSRADCSTMEPDKLKMEEGLALARGTPTPYLRRSAADELLASFCPLKAVDVLVNYRKLPPDFCGVIAFDHELPAWCSAMHYSVYRSLHDAISSVYGNAVVYEYGALPTDFVRRYDGRKHEVSVMGRLGRWAPCWQMPHLYVPSEDYIRDIKVWSDMCRDNVANWQRAGRGVIIAINPIMQTGPNWSDGQPVPVDAMTAIVEAAADAGMPLAIWQAGNTPEQFGRIVDAIAESVIPAVAAVEGRAK